MALPSVRPLATATALLVIIACALLIDSKPTGSSSIAQRPVRKKRQLGGIFSTVLDGVKNLINTGTGVAGLGTGMLNLGGDEGIGGVISGTLNLVSIGAEVLTGILGTVLGNGDLLGGLLPF